MRTAVLKAMLGGLWDYVWPVVRLYATTWGRELFAAAREAVVEAERQSRSADGWTREEKKAFVRAQLVGRDFGAGFPIADRIVELVIRLVVVRLDPEPEHNGATRVAGVQPTVA